LIHNRPRFAFVVRQGAHDAAFDEGCEICRRRRASISRRLLPPGHANVGRKRKPPMRLIGGNGMAIDVSANPLNVIVQLFFAPSNAGVTDNSQYVQTSESLINALPLLPDNLQALLAPIVPFIQPPLGTLFNSAWLGLQSSIQSTAAAQFQSAASSGGQNIDNVSCTLPQSGTVLAEVTPAQGASPASLSIDFSLPGGNFYFNSGLGDLSSWKLDFDADISIVTPVPVQPFNLTPAVTAALSNASMHPADWFTEGIAFIDDFFTALGNFFTGGNFISDTTWAEQQAAQQADQSQSLPASTVGPLLALFQVINTAGPQCVTLGLTQCAFSIANNSTLTLTVTHPLDPGPTIEDANNPGGVVAFAPTLAATATEAMPGTAVTAFGVNFPVDTTTSLDLMFANTSSGTPTQAQVRHGGQNHMIQAPSGSNTGVVYTYNPTGLTPGTTYVFNARCGDQITWSQWSSDFSLPTLPSQIIDLMLSPIGGGQTWQLGSAPLPPANTIWTCPGTIPAAAPTGQYNLEARLAGTLIAATPINIVTILAAGIDIIDPTTMAVVNGIFFGNQLFTLRGYGFPAGPVTISFDGVQVAMGAAGSDGSFTINLTTPANVSVGETVNVTATGGTATANLKLNVQADPK
jgi:hypothetical protein